MTRLIKRRARQMESEILQIDAEGTSNIDSYHLAALEDDNGGNSDSGGELNEIESSARLPTTEHEIRNWASSDHDNGRNSSFGSEPSETAMPAFAAAATLTHTEIDQIQRGNTAKDRKEYDALHQAASKGDWQAAQAILRIFPELANARVTRAGDTALHVAVTNKHTKFVGELLEFMEQKDLLLSLSLQNDGGYTAFHYAAASGVVDIASALINKCRDLPNTFARNGMIPLDLAVMLGMRDMVSYLQQCTDFQDFSADESFRLLWDATRNGMYDVALKILNKNVHLAVMVHFEGGTRNGHITEKYDGGTVLHLLAQQDISDISSSREAILEGFVDMFAAAPRLSWLKRKFEQPLIRKKARILAEKLWDVIQRLEKDPKLKLINNPPILHEAAKAGNVEFITMLTRADPNLVWDTDRDNNYTVFHIAVLVRQERVLRLIRQVGAAMYSIASLRDREGNNILHLVGDTPHGTGKSMSAALQMQRELLWFKEMEKILPPFCPNMKNKRGLRPQELFSYKHKRLLKDAELWMRETADSCMLIATIMLTVAFTAVFTVPGGNHSDLGSPILLKRTWFKVFVASDAVAMFCSTFSIMMFLSILTSRFCEDDFLLRLPLKLLLGLAGLFGSLVGTISAFTSACFLILNVERAWPPILLGFFACGFLTSMYLFQYLGLIVETIRLTFGHGYLLRPSKHSLY